MNINLTLIGQSITFALFVWFCYAFIWPPLVNALEKRKKQIADGLAAAERGQHEQELAEERAQLLEGGHHRLVRGGAALEHHGVAHGTPGLHRRSGPNPASWSSAFSGSMVPTRSILCASEPTVTGTPESRSRPR